MPLYDFSLPDLRAYRSEVVPPADFDAFWDRTLAETRVLPLAAEFVPHDAGLTLVDVFDVTFAGFGGHLVKAWLILPRERPRPLACVVKFIGYGGGRGFPQEHLLWPAA